MFYVQYLLTAVLLAAALWVGIPKVKASLESERAPRAQRVSAPAPTVAVHPTAASAVAPAATPMAAPEAPAEEPPAVAATFPAPAAEPPSPPPSATPPATVPAAAPVTVIYEPAEEEPVQQPGYTGPRYDWGVLAEEAQTYGVDGKIRVKLPAGTVVEKMDEKSSKNGRMSVCRILQNRRWQEGFVLATKHIVMFAGPFAEAPKAPSDKVIRYFQLQGLIDARMAALREAHLKKNPYFESYRRAATAFTEFQAKAKALTEQRDAAQGAMRTKLASELDRMRPEQGRLEASLKRAEGPYKKWKEQNGDGMDTIMNDLQIAKWSEERQNLQPEVAEMVPGI